MIGSISLVALLCLPSVTAILFRSNNPVATSNDRAINQSCLTLAEQGSCEFYTCFEMRLPCGRDWYMLRSGQYYCNKLQRERSSFNPEGQQFIDDAQVCLTRSLKDAYERDSIDCHELEHQAIRAITPCYTDNGFCDVVEENANAFFNVFEFQDLLQMRAGKVWRAIFVLITRCGRQALQQFSNNARESVSGAVNGLIGSIADRFGK